MSGSPRLGGWFATVVVLLAATPFAAEQPPNPDKAKPARSPLEIGSFVGIILPDQPLTATRDPGVEPAAGVRLGGGLVSRWNWFAELQTARFDSRSATGDAEMFAGRGGVERRIDPGRRAEPFVSLGWGYMSMTFDNASDFFSAFASAGLGQHIQLGAGTRLRWEIRADRTMAPDGLRGSDLFQPQATVGFSWVLGKRGIDEDGDGVPGNRDRCRGTPAGVLVDARGCALDSDGDSVPDGLDACADTQPEWDIGPDGCPLDADKDTVPDSVDACAATPAGALIDKTGCPLDSDGDGVFDGLDQCANTLKGIEVDKRGCFLDADEDGVYDGLGMDRCPGTPKGTKVDPFGCPVEEDDED